MRLYGVGFEVASFGLRLQGLGFRVFEKEGRFPTGDDESQGIERLLCSCRVLRGV